MKCHAGRRSLARRGCAGEEALQQFASLARDRVFSGDWHITPRLTPDRLTRKHVSPEETIHHEPRHDPRRIDRKILQIRLDRDLTWKWIASRLGFPRNSRPPLSWARWRCRPRRPARLGRRWTSTAMRSSFSSRYPTGARCPRRPDRPADLPLLRARQRLRHDHQGADPRGIRRRHHERHRLLDGHHARARPQGRPRVDHDEWKFLKYRQY